MSFRSFAAPAGWDAPAATGGGGTVAEPAGRGVIDGTEADVLGTGGLLDDGQGSTRLDVHAGRDG